jgi:spore coat protein U-like protein
MSVFMRNVRMRAAATAVVLPCLFAGGQADAATFSKTMNVTITVTPACALSVTDMNFGILTQVVGTEKATSTVTVNCTQGTFLQLSFLPTFAVANTSRNSAMTNGVGSKVNFSMALQGWWGYTGGWTTINGQLSATPGAVGLYKSVETLYVIY